MLGAFCTSATLILDVWLRSEQVAQSYMFKIYKSDLDDLGESRFSQSVARLAGFTNFVWFATQTLWTS